MCRAYLGFALKYVLEALRQPPASPKSANLFKFGVYALEQFKAQLAGLHLYRQQILQIATLKLSNAALYSYIERLPANPPGQSLPTSGQGQQAGSPPIQPQQATLPVDEPAISETSSRPSSPVRSASRPSSPSSVGRSPEKVLVVDAFSSTLPFHPC
eukprot:c20130_g3_i1.p1 GENE.c20130_g3_i1~~c20130_g3_i1.p1  ORF type:complete len:157 (-),score=34.48 c20130_g3_i1:57-527(-)